MRIASLFSAFTLSACLAMTPCLASASLPSQTPDGKPLPTLAPMLEQVTPAVVDISVAGTQVAKQRIPDIYRYFFGAPREQLRERPFRALGSGVIIDAAKGHVVTNHHVVAEADKIIIRLKDGRELDAKMIGYDDQSDIALLEVDADNLVEVKMADSDKIRVGDFAIAVGNPFGLGQTVTSGIISALGRSNLNIENYENFIQTDAAINSGNSGGALLNLNGELIGINTAIVGPNGGNVGIGFAIPSNMMSSLVMQLAEYGEVRRGVLGISGGELTPELAETFGSESNHGAFVSQVFPDSAADKGGIKAGDIIVSIDGKEIRTFGELRAKIATMGSGTEVKIGILRDGKQQTMKVVLQQMEDQPVRAQLIHPRLEGATLSTAPNDAAVEGVLIEELEQRSPAAAMGLKKSDIIIGLNKQRIKSLPDLRELLEDEPSVLALNIYRDGAQLYIVIR